MASVTGASLVLIFAVCAAGFLLSALLGRKRAPLVIAVAGTLTSIPHGSYIRGRVLLTGQSYHAALWTLDGFGRFTLRIDATELDIPVGRGDCLFFDLSLCKNFIDDQREAAYSAHRYGVLYFALMASVVLILVAGDAPLFLISWECMSILCFLLLNYESRQTDKTAGYIMLAMSEAGFLAVAVAFLILGRTATDFRFPLWARRQPVFHRRPCGACFFSGSSDLESRRAWFPSISGFHDLIRRRRLSSFLFLPASRSILASTEFCGSTPTWFTRVTERVLSH